MAATPSFMPNNFRYWFCLKILDFHRLYGIGQFKAKDFGVEVQAPPQAPA